MGAGSMIGGIFQGVAGMEGINFGQEQMSEAVDNPVAVQLQTQAPQWKNQFPGLTKVTRTAAGMESEALGRDQAMQTVDPTAQAQINGLEQDTANTSGQIAGTTGSSGDTIAGLAALSRTKTAAKNDIFAGANARRNERVNNFTNVILPNAAKEEADVQDAQRQDYLMNLAKAQQLMQAGRQNVTSGTQQVGDSFSSMGDMGMGGGKK